MKTVAVIFGGQSTEHDVSIVTALTSIIRPLKATGRYKVEPVYIAKDGRWYWDKKLGDISLYQTGEIEEFMRRAPKVHLLFDDGLTLVKSSQFAGRKSYKKIDVVFPAMHGTHGEDGELMGLLQLAGVPFVGCDMTSSAIAMDKVIAKVFAQANDIPIVKYIYLHRDAYSKKASEILGEIEKTLTFPMFIKPARLGSSIGITRATTLQELQNGIEVALHYDDKVLVEEEVPNLVEVTLPIMGNHGDELITAMLERPLTKPEDFFDFDTKYMGGGKKGGKSGAKSGAQGYSEVPAKIEKKLYDQAVNTGKSVYRALECSGIARVDMLIDEKAEIVYFNEVNPLPGDLYAHNWRAAGKSNVDLVEDLIHLAEQRHSVKKSSTTTFSTNYLKQF